jgi:asparagine synthase (glutamine-hydrolysing)
MPGIVGIIGKGSNKENVLTLQQMMKCMIHESFYTSGTYINERLGIWVGWVCHEESFSDCMPVWNETKDVCLLFSGEDFIDESYINNLKTKGHHFDPENASYLVHLFEEMGLKFLEKLNGWFSGLLIDLNEKKIVLFNDRYGFDRIYYHKNKNAFYFSSEAKSLLKILPNLRRLDISSLGEFFYCGYPMENKTIFPGVSLIPGGSMWTFYPHGQTRREVYFKKETWENQPQLNGKEYYEKLKETFSNILPRYFRGKQRVAMSLTGGIDTRMIMAWAHCHPFKVPCYTFGGMYRECADVKIAREVARVSQQQHETISMNRNFFAEFPALAKKTVYYTDGTMNVSGSVELFVNKIAREIAPVRLTGNYGDQVLRSYIGFKPISLFEGIFDPEFAHHIRAAALTYSKINQDHLLSIMSFKQVPWEFFPRFALERTQVTPRSPFLDNDLVALVYQAPPDLAKSLELSLRLIAEGNTALSRIPTDRGILYRPIPIVTQFQRQYQTFTFKAEYAYDYGMPQWLSKLDHFLTPLHLERIFLGRHKFYHFRLWYRNELSRYVKDILLDSRTLNRPYLNGKNLELIVSEHLKGDRNYTWEIHLALTIELIQRHLIEGD